MTPRRFAIQILITMMILMEAGQGKQNDVALILARNLLDDEDADRIIGDAVKAAEKNQKK